MPDAPLGPTLRGQLASDERRRRAAWIDRIVGRLIALGGIGVIASVIGILVFIAATALPLFRDARIGPATPASMEADDVAGHAPPAWRVLGTDEHAARAYVVTADGRVRAWSLHDGRSLHEARFPGLDDATVTSASRSAAGGVIAAGTPDGRVALAQVEFPARDHATAGGDAAIAVRGRGVIQVDEARRAIRDVSAREADGRVTVACLVEDTRVEIWSRDAAGRMRRESVPAADGERFTLVRVGNPVEVAAGTTSGRVYLWRLEDDRARLVSVSPASRQPITALEWALGDRTLLVGDAGGRLSGWFPARLTAGAPEPARVEADRFAPHAAAVVAIRPSARDRSFVTAAADGSMSLHHATSERTQAVLPASSTGIEAVALSPRSDALVVVGRDGRVARYGIDNPHPETTAGTLFGPVWYEGYPAPAFVWQSTGASDEYEPKLSLVPLVSGTLKAACYALLFAVPLAVMGALYTSQFVHAGLRARLKPAIEFMAAVPSVVIGLVAGLWLAALLERHLVGALLALPSGLVAGVVGHAAWMRWLPARVRGRARPGTELLVVVPMVAAGAAAAWVAGPWLELVLLGGDARQWLDAHGFAYEQRNGLVVGLALGFAVVPVIYTIADEAFAAVPARLTAASAALGASRWQTARRVVVPTAAPGVLAAVLVGLGRAIGETMIVLMVAGNTPLTDWSVFTGLRTLAANMAVEVPEAPAGGTLYRVLFLSAAVLFVLTFAVNTVAEVVRQRLRARHEGM